MNVDERKSWVFLILALYKLSYILTYIAHGRLYPAFVSQLRIEKACLTRVSLLIIFTISVVLA